MDKWWRRYHAGVCVLALVAAIGGCRTSGLEPVHLRGNVLDHIIVYIDSLERGMSWFEQHAGVRPQYLGQIRGKGRGPETGDGSEVAVLGLGESRFLFLVAAYPGEREHVELRRMFSRYVKPTPVGWAVRVADLESVAADAQMGGRWPSSRMFSIAVPDGESVRWETTVSPDHPTSYAPVFVRWVTPLLHPSSIAPEGCLLESLYVVHPMAADIRQLLERVDVAAVVVTRDSNKIALDVTLTCVNGSVRLGLG